MKLYCKRENCLKWQRCKLKEEFYGQFCEFFKPKPNSDNPEGKK